MFPEMYKVVPEGTCGAARVEHFTVTPTDSGLSALRPREYVRPGQYARLMVHDRVMMSDTNMERRSNAWFVRSAHGRVLIGGLGLGMIVHAVLAKPEVEHVTIVEKSADVIALVAPTLPAERVTIVHADIFEWRPEKGAKWHTIYFDIWPTITTDSLPEMAQLHRRFARHRELDGWMGSWMQDELRALRRQERARRSRW